MMKFFALCLALMTLLPMLNAQDRPFPQNVQYNYGVKPANISSDYVKSEYDLFKSTLLVECGNSLRVIFSSAKNETRGYAIGIGMLISAYMGDKETFDKLFKFYKSKLSTQAKDLMAWNVTCESIISPSSTTNTDIDVAFALIVAYNQWSGSYINEAKLILARISENMITSCSGIKAIYPGYNNYALGGCNETGIQYYTPAFFRVFAKVTENQLWEDLANDSYKILNNSAHKTTGLVPDWQTVEGNPAGSKNYNFAYDACPVPWRMSLDYLWNGNESARNWCTKVSNWAYNIDPKNIADGYKLDGTPTGHYHTSAFVGGFAVAAMSNTQQVADAFGDELKIIKNNSDWFNLSLRCLYLMTVSGNFWEPLRMGTTAAPSLKQHDGTLKIFPNPSKNGIFTLEVERDNNSENKIDIEIVDTNGELIFSGMLCNGENSCTINLEKAKGIYLLKASEDGMVTTRKISIE